MKKIKNIATFSLGVESSSKSCGPAANNNEARYDEVEALLNCHVVLEESSEEGSYVFNKSENWIVYEYIEHLLVVENTSKPSCYMLEGQVDFSFSHDYDYTFETPRFKWLFIGRSEWVTLGLKKSYQLLKENGGVIPEWLEEKVEGYKLAGNGWKVIN